MCYPLTFSATDFYLGHDLALLTANIKSDLRFVSQRWKQEGQYGTCATFSRTRTKAHEISRPTYCIVSIIWFEFSVMNQNYRTYKKCGFINSISCNVFQVITENNLQDPQFPELLSLLCELRNLKVEGVKIRLGR